MQLLFTVLLALTLVIALLCSVENGIHMIAFFLVMVFCQNLIAILFHPYIPPSYNTLFSLTKELMLYGALALDVMRYGRLKLDKYNWLTAVFLAVYLAVSVYNLLVTPAGLQAAVIALRYTLLPVLCLYVGRRLHISQRDARRLPRMLVAFSLCLALAGLVEVFCLGNDFWQKIGYGDYAVKVKGNVAYSLRDGVTVNFYTWDFGIIPLRRLVSVTADPLATAYLLFLGLLLLFTGAVSRKDVRGKRLYYAAAAVIVTVACALCLSKAIFLLAGIAFVLGAFYRKMIPKEFFQVGIVACGVIMAFGLGYYLENSAILTSSVKHLMGLVYGFRAGGLLGGGLGTAGSTALMLTGTWTEVSESYIGGTVAQLGFVGLLAFIGFMGMQILRLMRLYRMYRSGFTLFAIFFCIGNFVCMLFSDSSVSMMGTGLYYVLIGLAQQDRIYTRRLRYDYHQDTL